MHFIIVTASHRLYSAIKQRLVKTQVLLLVDLIQILPMTARLWCSCERQTFLIKLNSLTRVQEHLLRTGAYPTLHRPVGRTGGCLFVQRTRDDCASWRVTVSLKGRQGP